MLAMPLFMKLKTSNTGRELGIEPLLREPLLCHKTTLLRGFLLLHMPLLQDSLYLLEGPVIQQQLSKLLTLCSYDSIEYYM